MSPCLRTPCALPKEPAAPPFGMTLDPEGGGGAGIAGGQSLDLIQPGEAPAQSPGQSGVSPLPLLPGARRRSPNANRGRGSFFGGAAPASARVGLLQPLKVAGMEHGQFGHRGAPLWEPPTRLQLGHCAHIPVHGEAPNRSLLHAPLPSHGHTLALLQGAGGDIPQWPCCRRCLLLGQ